MKKNRTALAVVTMIGLYWGLTTAYAQTAENSLPPGLLACSEETDVMVRLSCYDREIAALKSTPPTPAVAPTPVPAAAPLAEVVSDMPAVAAAVPASAVTNVAVAEAIPASQPNPAPVVARTSKDVDDFGYDRPLEDITAEIVKIRKRPYGELIIHLDNGQVWEQKHLDRRFRLSVGETVVVRKSAVAGYRLSGDSNRSIQVTRRK